MVLKKTLMIITSFIGVAALLSLAGCANSGTARGDLSRGNLAQRVTQLENRVTQLKLQRESLGEVNDGINFAVNADQLLPASRRVIDRFINTVSNPQAARYFVAGYTDTTGAAKLNYQLGLRRANSVARYLIITKGIDPSHVTTGSHGKGDPFATNKSQIGRLLNRHVDIHAYREVVR